MGEVVYRCEWMQGTHEIKPPRYRVTRTEVTTGWWPFRKTEWMYHAQCDWSTMTMSAEAYCWFKAQFWQQIDEAWHD